jgi:phosphoribosyl 1,2-cyclic phosphodiesterase
MVEVCALASGSNGNSYYIGNEKEAILVDAGINCKQLLLRMEERQLNPAKVKAVFITHEHTDHICGVRVFCNKMGIPAFFTRGTFLNTSSRHKPKLYRFIDPGDSVTLGDFEVYAFTKKHDASEPCSYRVETDHKSIGVLTDLGSYSTSVIEHLKQCDILFLESNYDEKMLWEGAYPWLLKKRIASDVGHLSNLQALNLITEHAGERLHTIFLSHLSGENNTPEIAYLAFKPLHQAYKIIKTSRHEASELLMF